MTKGKGHKAQHQPPTLPPDRHEAAALNRAFYAADPASYFEQRLWTVMELASQSDGERRAEERVYRFGSLTTTIPSVEALPADELAHERLVAVEAEMLVHHLGETLLRMYFAHRDKPACPWVEVSKLRSPGAFKRELARIIDLARRDDLRAGVSWVWLGHDSAPAHLDSSEVPQWIEAADIVIAYLVYFAKLLMERAPAYNAAKHGLALSPGLAHVDLSSFVPGLSAGGPSLAWLTHQDETDGRHVAVQSRWLHPDQELYVAAAGGRLLRDLWRIARIRYVQWPMPEGGLQPVRVPPLATLIAAFEEPLGDEGRIVITDATVPPEVFCPPGAGADAVIERWRTEVAGADAAEGTKG